MREIKGNLVDVVKIIFEDGQIPHFRSKWGSLSEYVKEIKQGFSRVLLVRPVQERHCGQGRDPDQLPGLYRSQPHPGRHCGETGRIPVVLDRLSCAAEE